MANAKSLASADALMKRYYLGGAEIPADLVEEVEGPFLRLVESDTDAKFGGKLKAMMPTKTGGMAGGSHRYNKSYRNATPSTSADYDIPALDEFQHIFLDGKYLRAARSNGDLTYMNDKAITDSEEAIKACHKRQSWKVWSDTGGAIGRMAAAVNLATTAGEFVNRLNIHRLERGMWLVASASAAGTGIRTGRVRVTNVNRIAGNFTTDTAFSTAIPDIVASDYLFIDGDEAAGWAGWPTWVPFLHANVGTLYGVDRTEDVSRQAGVRIPLPATEKPFTFLTELMRWVTELNKRTNLIFTTPYELARLQLDIRSHDYNVDSRSLETLGYDGIQVRFPTSGRVMTLMADPYMAPVHMPETSPLYCATTKRAWMRLLAGPLSWLDDDGRIWRYVEGENVLQAGYGGFGNFVCPRTDECFVVGDQTYVTNE